MEAQSPALVHAAKTDWTKGNLTARASALCAFAAALTLHPAAMTPAALAPLRAAGLDDAGILDLTQVIAYFNYINRVADGLGIDLEAFMPPANTATVDSPGERPGRPVL